MTGMVAASAMAIASAIGGCKPSLLAVVDGAVVTPPSGKVCEAVDAPPSSKICGAVDALPSRKVCLTVGVAECESESEDDDGGGVTPRAGNKPVMTDVSGLKRERGGAPRFSLPTGTM